MEQIYIQNLIEKSIKNSMWNVEMFLNAEYMLIMAVKNENVEMIKFLENDCPDEIIAFASGYKEWNMDNRTVYNYIRNFAVRLKFQNS